MEEAGKTDSAIQARCDMFRYRVPQEFYDLEKDPACVVNLIQDPQCQDLVKRYQDILRRWMVDTHDHCLPAFDVREDPAKLADAVANYPKLLNRNNEKESDTESSTKGNLSTEDRSAIRKERRAARKSEK